MRSKRGLGHHAIVRAITSFASLTNGLCATSAKDDTTNLIPDITIRGLDDSADPYYIELKTSERRGEDLHAWARKERRDAIAKYRGLPGKVHVLTIAHDGRIDAPSEAIIRKLQGARTALGLRHPSDFPQVPLKSLLGHQLVLAEAAIQQAYDTRVSFKLSH